MELTRSKPAIQKPACEPSPACTATHRIGDATQPQGDGPIIIAHVCNTDVEGWGAGFSGALSRRWPQPEAAYRAAARTVGLRLGRIQRVELKAPAQTWVFNLIAQRSIGTDRLHIELGALEEVLAATARSARVIGASVHMPGIGCGLGGDQWSDIGPMIDRLVAAEVPTFIYTLPVDAEKFAPTRELP